jgi:alpha-D-ribose 1-methylphosphonate 5-triphosphate synthase subunit PhnG
MPEAAEDLKTRLLRVISAAEADQVAALLDRLWASGRFRIRRVPRTGLVMVSARDPFDTPFHLGEVLVSEAQVVCDGQVGCGLICGDEPQRALLLAAVEAAAPAGGTAMREWIGDLIGHLEKTKGQQEARMSRLAAATRVRFTSMKKETVDFGSLGDLPEQGP